MGITLVPALLPALHCPVWPALLCLLALQLIATSLENRQPCLFFCKLGKDRTGLMAALVLAACGLSEEEIVADYVRCGAVLWAARLLCWGGDIGSACQRRCAYVRVMFWRCAAALPACLPDLPIRLPACLSRAHPPHPPPPPPAGLMGFTRWRWVGWSTRRICRAWTRMCLPLRRPRRCGA